MKERGWNNYAFEDVIRGHEDDSEFVMVADWFMCPLSQFGKTIPQLQERIQKVVESKCYHYGNMKKDLYVFSIVDGDSKRLCFQSLDYTVQTKIDDIDEVLRGNEKICFPACEIWIYDVNGQLITSGYGNYKDDIRYKILCEIWKILDFSSNRIEEGKKPKDFYECEFKLEDLSNYWGEDKGGYEDDGNQ